MDTKTVAQLLGTETRVLRRFLRDPKSTFSAVGSGSRYQFTEADIPELERRFNDWMGTKSPTTVTRVVKDPCDSDRERRERDEAVWAEEGRVELPDLRDPRVLRAVRAKAAVWDQRLNERLLAAGLHISQMRDRRPVAA